MRMRLFLACCWFSTVFGGISRLPEVFRVRERFLSIPETLDIETEVEPFAVAKKEIFSLTAAYDLEDLEKRPLASAKAHFFAWTTVADIMDPDGKKIGTLEEEYFKIL